LLKTVISDVEVIAILFSEHRRLGIVLLFEDASKEVIFEFCDKVL
jgi:hypothetical protein